jgi:hypothetical protein
LAPVFSALKWALVGGSFVLLIVGMVAAVVAAIKNRPSR